MCSKKDWHAWTKEEELWALTWMFVLDDWFWYSDLTLLC